MAESDFDSISNNRSLCDAEGNIGPDEFCAVMLKELRYYMQHRLTEEGFNEYRTPADTEFTSLGATKMILTEQLSTSRRIDTLMAKLDALNPTQPASDPTAGAGPESVEASKTSIAEGVQSPITPPAPPSPSLPGADRQSDAGLAWDGGRQDAILQSILSVQEEILQHVLQGAAREANMSQALQRIHEMLEASRHSQARKRSRSGRSVRDADTPHAEPEPQRVPRALRQSTRSKHVDEFVVTTKESESRNAHEEWNTNSLPSILNMPNQSRADKLSRLRAAEVLQGAGMQSERAVRRPAAASIGTETVHRSSQVSSAGNGNDWATRAHLHPQHEEPRALGPAEVVLSPKVASRRRAAMTSAQAHNSVLATGGMPTASDQGSPASRAAAVSRRSHLNGDFVVLEGLEAARIGQDRILYAEHQGKSLSPNTTGSTGKKDASSIGNEAAWYGTSAAAGGRVPGVDGLLGPQMVRVARHALSEKQAAAARAATEAAVASLQAQGAIPPGLLGGIGATQGQRGVQPGTSWRAPVASPDWQPSQRPPASAS